MDAGYSGDWSVKAFNYGDDVFFVKKGDSIAQVLILKKPNIILKKTSDDEFKKYERSSIRGSKGFGEISLRENSNAITTHKVIYASLKIEGLHSFPSVVSAFGEEVEYLKHLHRHTFVIKVFSEVSELDREREFVCIKHTVRDFLHQKFFTEKYQCCNFNSLSCEAIAQLLIEEFHFCRVEVSEDGENGAILEF